MLSYSFLFSVLGAVLGTVDHDGINITALPIPGTYYKDGMLEVDLETGKNATTWTETKTQNVTVRTPFISIHFANSSDHPIDTPIEDVVKGAATSFLPRDSDLDDATVVLNTPIRIEELANLATAESPAQFREKFYGLGVLERIISEFEEKSKYYYELKHLLNQPNTLIPGKLDVADSLVSKKRSIVKREAIWKAEFEPLSRPLEVGAVHAVHQHSRYHPNHKIIRDFPKYHEFVYGRSHSVKKRSVFVPLVHHHAPVLGLVHHVPIVHHIHPLPPPLLIRPLPIISPKVLSKLLRAVSGTQLVRSMAHLNPVSVLLPQPHPLIAAPYHGVTRQQLQPMVQFPGEFPSLRDLRGIYVNTMQLSDPNSYTPELQATEAEPNDDNFIKPPKNEMKQFLVNPVRPGFLSLFHDLSLTRK